MDFLMWCPIIVLHVNLSIYLSNYLSIHLSNYLSIDRSNYHYALIVFKLLEELVNRMLYLIIDNTIYT